MKSSQDLIRNFCVISHIDHGKTTLTDRFLAATNTVAQKDRQDRLLDSNPIERERGITIKLAPVRMIYHQGSKAYILNLIDTPGHVDFAYEVSRSLAACEGALLLVDATQGIQAQTLANSHKALEANLDIIPVINKIDLANAEVDKVASQLQSTFAFNSQEILTISAKTGQNLDSLFQAILKRISPPKRYSNQNLKALVFNSFYHPHKGVIAYVRVVSGQLTATDSVAFISNQTCFQAEEVGYFLPDLKPTQTLFSGEVGYIATGLKDISLCRVGDTLTHQDSLTHVSALPGYLEPQPMVFMDLYPLENQHFLKLSHALEKLALSDSSLHYKAVSSSVLGSGYKIGFQGLLHADIVQERLEREFNLKLITTSPSVEYRVELKNHRLISVFSPDQFPQPSLINQTKEPFISLTIFTPNQYLGGIMNLCKNSRAKLQSQEFLVSQVKLVYSLPLQELVSGFFSSLKSISSGFASLDWQFLGFKPSLIVKLEVYLNHQPIPPLAVLVPQSQSLNLAKKLAKSLKAIIPRQQFEIPIQVALGGKILARQTIKAFRKDVTAKLYGGDPTRRQKLLSKQKKGKKRMKQIGRVNLPQEAFLAVLKR